MTTRLILLLGATALGLVGCGGRSLDPCLPARMQNRSKERHRIMFRRIASSWSVVFFLWGGVALAEPPPKGVEAGSGSKSGAIEEAWNVPDLEKLPQDAWGRLVRKGYELTAQTFAHIGPEVADPSKRFSGNNLACQSCHLEAGTKKYGLPFIGVFGDFPQYRAREGKIGTLEDRVNGCMARSMNGRPLDWQSEEMRAFVAYIKFLSTGRPIGAPTNGRGSGRIADLGRAADPKAGAIVFQQHCVVCHGENGQGKRVGQPGDRAGYQFPPLWGKDSFNDGAGMARLIAAAGFILSNMPLGVTHEAPLLKEEEAWDVAAYLQSMERPHKANLDHDFPNRLEKPVDAAYGPFVDGLPDTQHKLGPYQPIRDKIKSLKQTKSQ